MIYNHHGDYMKIVNSIFEVFQTFNKETKIIIKSLYFIIFIMYFSGLIIISCANELFSDYDTALYWMNEVLISANRIFSAVILPVMLFEFVLHKEKSTS